MATARDPQDHQPARARVRKPTQAEMDQTAGVIAEVDTEDTVAEGYITAELCGEPIHVLPQGQWRQSTNDAITSGRLNDWAALALTPESYERWLDIDPTNDDTLAFFEDFGRNAGSSLGDSRLSAASSRSMRRR